ncbi:Transcription factor PHYTOCHROME INTERACTING FACTOR-LIKE 15 [Glycine soja]|uniref:Transcription factor PHYTOCHROME INTERACTING FACTOR-LIKE 15 isoform A n=1 Tax=Glycine soja TaxID=3848 RepID=A0A0B2Q2Z4_GLYSO|nr:transcription factor PIF3-like [Glycine soja]KHN14177.1 Transcription factor PIF3 [Glycine soja]RZC21979.1 Transcription factor PHYTOCHROME INTERACTING FACTOR-LIKE 15 isoform A [Glycine soja]
MIQKMFDPSRSGMTRSSSHVASIYDNDFLELVWENGEVVVRGGSSNRSRKTNEERIHEDASINKRTRLNPLLYSLEDHFPPQRDSDMSTSHQSNGQDSCGQSSQSKLHEEFANLLKPVSIGNNHLQQCLPSSPLKKQRTVDSTQTPPTPKVNFSNFSIPAVFLKSTTHQGNSATQQTNNHSSPARMEEIIEARKVEQSVKESHGFQKQTSLTVERSTKLPTPPVDEHSEAVGHNCGVLGIHRSQGQLRCDQTSTSEALIRAKAKAYNNNTNMCHEPLLASSSVCSLGASNDPNLGLRKHEDTETYLSDNDGEPEDMVKQDRDGNRVRRIRNPVVHNLSEKKRREKINKKMRTLKELIPNCNKVDKASMLDDAIDYLKTLKLQLQIMSMGNGLWPLMMLPAATTAHHMNPQLGMGFRPPQLPIPPSLSAITDNRLQMFGCFPNQIPPMPAMPHAPFFPIIANSATQPHLANTTNLAEHLAASLHGNATKLAPPSQVSFQQHSCTSTPTLSTPFIFPQK